MSNFIRQRNKHQKFQLTEEQNRVLADVEKSLEKDFQKYLLTQNIQLQNTDTEMSAQKSIFDQLTASNKIRKQQLQALNENLNAKLAGDAPLTQSKSNSMYSTARILPSLASLEAQLQNIKDQTAATQAQFVIEEERHSIYKNLYSNILEKYNYVKQQHQQVSATHKYASLHFANTSEIESTALKKINLTQKTLQKHRSDFQMIQVQEKIALLKIRKSQSQEKSDVRKIKMQHCTLKAEIQNFENKIEEQQQEITSLDWQNQDLEQRKQESKILVANIEALQLLHDLFINNRQSQEQKQQIQSLRRNSKVRRESLARRIHTLQNEEDLEFQAAMIPIVSKKSKKGEDSPQSQSLSQIDEKDSIFTADDNTLAKIEELELENNQHFKFKKLTIENSQMNDANPTIEHKPQQKRNIEQGGQSMLLLEREQSPIRSHSQSISLFYDHESQDKYLQPSDDENIRKKIDDFFIKSGNNPNAFANLLLSAYRKMVLQAEGLSRRFQNQSQARIDLSQQLNRLSQDDQNDQYNNYLETEQPENKEGIKPQSESIAFADEKYSTQLEKLKTRRLQNQATGLRVLLSLRQSVQRYRNVLQMLCDWNFLDQSIFDKLFGAIDGYLAETKKGYHAKRRQSVFVLENLQKKNSPINLLQIVDEGTQKIIDKMVSAMEYEAFQTLTFTELVNIYLRVFTGNEEEAKDWATALKQDLMLIFFQSEEALVLHLQNLKEKASLENKQTQIIEISLQELGVKSQHNFLQQLKKIIQFYNSIYEKIIFQIKNLRQENVTADKKYIDLQKDRFFLVGKQNDRIKEANSRKASFCIEFRKGQEEQQFRQEEDLQKRMISKKNTSISSDAMASKHKKNHSLHVILPATATAIADIVSSQHGSFMAPDYKQMIIQLADAQKSRFSHYKLISKKDGGDTTNTDTAQMSADGKSRKKLTVQEEGGGEDTELICDPRNSTSQGTVKRIAFHGTANTTSPISQINTNFKLLQKLKLLEKTEIVLEKNKRGTELAIPELLRKQLQRKGTGKSWRRSVQHQTDSLQSSDREKIEKNQGLNQELKKQGEDSKKRMNSKSQSMHFSSQSNSIDHRTYFVQNLYSKLNSSLLQPLKLASLQASASTSAVANTNKSLLTPLSNERSTAQQRQRFTPLSQHHLKQIQGDNTTQSKVSQKNSSIPLESIPNAFFYL